VTFRPRPSLWFRSACPRGLAWNGAGAKFVVAVLPLMLPTPASNGQEPQKPTVLDRLERPSDCASLSGTTIDVTAPSALWESLERRALTKDEFETTAEFEARKALAGHPADKIVAVRATFDSEYATSDADTEAFIIARYAWDNLADGVDRIDGVSNATALPNSFDQRLSVGLTESESAKDEYVGTNAFGATQNVLVVTRERYSVYDRVLPGATVDAAGSWETDTVVRQERHGLVLETPAVTVPVPRVAARSVKSTMLAGIVIRPRPPYMAVAEKRWRPTVRDPRDVTAVSRIILADILCAVLTDRDGRVLRAVSSMH